MKFKPKSASELHAILSTVKSNFKQERFEAFKFKLDRLEQQYLRDLNRMHEELVDLIVEPDSIVVNNDKLHEAGYISYLLQQDPSLFNKIPKGSNVVLNFDTLDWTSIYCICEAQPSLVQYVNFHMIIKMVGRSGSFDKHCEPVVKRFLSLPLQSANAILQNTFDYCTNQSEPKLAAEQKSNTDKAFTIALLGRFLKTLGRHEFAQKYLEWSEQHSLKAKQKSMQRQHDAIQSTVKQAAKDSARN